MTNLPKQTLHQLQQMLGEAKRRPGDAARQYEAMIQAAIHQRQDRVLLFCFGPPLKADTPPAFDPALRQWLRL